MKVVNNPLIRVRNLCVSLSGRKKDPETDIIEDFSIDIEKNSISALVGTSGAGKSLFAKTLCALLPPGIYVRSGWIEYDGQNKEYQDLEKLRGKDVFYSPQEAVSSLNPVIKVGNQIREGTYKTHDDCVSLLEELGFTPDNAKRVLGSYAFQLSGGECQRCILAMALIREPRLIILDEPFSAVEDRNREQTLNLLLQLKKNATILLITHNQSILPKVDYIHQLPYKTATKEAFQSLPLF